MKEPTIEELQTLLQELLHHVHEAHLDSGFNGPVYHYYFDHEAINVVQTFLEKLK